MSLNRPVRTKIAIRHSVIMKRYQILQPPESYDKKLDNFENGRNNEADDTEKSYGKAEEEEEEEEQEQDIHLQIDSKQC